MSHKMFHFFSKTLKETWHHISEKFEFRFPFSLLLFHKLKDDDIPYFEKRNYRPSSIRRKIRKLIPVLRFHVEPSMCNGKLSRFLLINFGRRTVQLHATGNLCAPGLSAISVSDYPRRSPKGTGELIW